MLWEKQNSAELSQGVESSKMHDILHNMKRDIPEDKLVGIVQYFISQDAEAEHVEFKENKHDEKTIAHNISTITNYMTIHHKRAIYKLQKNSIR